MIQSLPSRSRQTASNHLTTDSSNYIWAWENNKIMREAVLAAGGAVLAERYAPVAEHQLLSLSFPGVFAPA